MSGRAGPFSYTGKTVDGVMKPGLYGDGGSLYLSVKPLKGKGQSIGTTTDQPSAAITKSWIFRYRANGKLRDMGLGPYPDVSLERAREKAGECRQLRLDGMDPIDAKRALADRRKAAAARSMTFQECAEAYIAAQKNTERNGAGRQAKLAMRLANQLKIHVYPVFGELPLHAIDRAFVQRALEQVAKTSAEKALRMREIIEAIFDWAEEQGYGGSGNPARYENRPGDLPAKAGVSPVDHEERRRHVVSIASRILAKSGLGAVTIRDVAEAAGCSTTVVTHYFTNKDELLVLIFKQNIVNHNERWNKYLPESNGDLKSFIRNMMFIDDDGIDTWRIWLAYIVQLASHPEIATIHRNANADQVDRWTHILQIMKTQGLLKPGINPRTAASRLVASIVGLAIQIIFDIDAWTPARQNQFIEAQIQEICI